MESGRAGQQGAPSVCGSPLISRHPPLEQTHTPPLTETAPPEASWRACQNAVFPLLALFVFQNKSLIERPGERVRGCISSWQVEP